MIELEIIRSHQSWNALSAPWNRLLAKSVTDVPFLRHEFLLAWWQHRGGGEWGADDQLYVILGRDASGELVGALPLFLSKNHAGLPVLIGLGSIEIADFLDLLALPEHLAAFLDAALAHLTGPDAPAWEALELFNLLEASPSLAALSSAAEKHALTFSQQRLQPAPRIALPETFEAYMEGLDGRYRREMLRKMRNALRYFIPVTITKVESGDDLSAEMEGFITMMREEADKNAFLNQAMEAQMQAIARAGFDHGWLDLRFMLVGREKAAGYFNFVYNNQVWVYNSAKAEKFASLSPGISLMGLLIEEAIQAGYSDFDLMRGDEEYKYQLGGVDRWVVKASINR
ncbi:MAG: GNAT family N-acetyltransferase [Anaerolineales bacterium]|nr:GNAT family N-acetyltransferase [Anaerolineales bacterium]